MNKTVYRLCLLSVLITILFVQEQVLSFIPSVQFTFLLMIIYSKCLTFKESILVIIIHVLLDNLFLGSLNIITTPAMLIGYLFIPILINLLFKRVDNTIKLSFISILFTGVYCLIYIVPNSIFLGIKPLDYLISDLPYSILMCVFNFICILWLYEPLHKFISKKLIIENKE